MIWLPNDETSSLRTGGQHLVQLFWKKQRCTPAVFEYTSLQLMILIPAACSSPSSFALSAATTWRALPAGTDWSVGLSDLHLGSFFQKRSPFAIDVDKKLKGTKHTTYFAGPVSEALESEWCLSSETVESHSLPKPSSCRNLLRVRRGTLRGRS